MVIKRKKAVEDKGSYEEQHKAAYEAIKDAGAYVEFDQTIRTVDSNNPSHFKSKTRMLDGVAIQEGESTREYYSSESLVEIETAILRVAMRHYKDKPPLGSKVMWDKQIYLVDGVTPEQPDGYPIYSEITITR